MARFSKRMLAVMRERPSARPIPRSLSTRIVPRPWRWKLSLISRAISASSGTAWSLLRRPTPMISGFPVFESPTRAFHQLLLGQHPRLQASDGSIDPGILLLGATVGMVIMASGLLEGTVD